MDTKKIFIMGDSYSTFVGCIPKGMPAYYPDGDVTEAEATWWYQLTKELGAELVRNDSWSGSTVGYTGYDGDCSGDSSFIYRLDCLKENGFFEENKIDTALLFGGTNDSWSGAPLGEPKMSDWTREDLFNVLPALCCFIKKARDYMPASDIYFLINTDLKPEIGETVRLACGEYGVTVVDFDDISKNIDHPDVLGMTQIKDRVLGVMNGTNK